MIEFLALIDILLILSCLVSFIVGLISPTVFSEVFKKKTNRKTVASVFGGGAVLLFIVLVILAVNDPIGSKNKPSQVTNTKLQVKMLTPTPKIAKKSPAISPTPTGDPCASQLGTPYYSSCLSAFRPRLKVTVLETAEALVMTNNEDVSLTDCDYSIGSDINDNFYELGINSSYAAIPSHETVSVPWGYLTKQDGTRFQYYSQAPADLVIDCTGSKGDEEWSNY